MVKNERDSAITQLNHALNTLTPIVDVATVRHHLDYVKTRLTEYIHTAEAKLKFKDLQLVEKENEIKTLEKRIQIFEGLISQCESSDT